MTTTKNAVAMATLVATLSVLSLVSGPVARADDDPPPVLHHVKYVVSASNPIYADIYYLDQEPAIFADYSHNPYQYVPNVQIDIAPGRPWVYELNLANPDEWAMVSASRGPEPATPQFHCDLTVDGKVVVSKDGPTGVLCSLRHW
jgi:hypothetical protein